LARVESCWVGNTKSSIIGGKGCGEKLRVIGSGEDANRLGNESVVLRSAGVCMGATVVSMMAEVAVDADADDAFDDSPSSATPPFRHGIFGVNFVHEASSICMGETESMMTEFAVADGAVNDVADGADNDDEVVESPSSETLPFRHEIFGVNFVQEASPTLLSLGLKLTTRPLPPTLMSLSLSLLTVDGELKLSIKFLPLCIPALRTPS
jgi:hypothetical protein